MNASRISCWALAVSMGLLLTLAGTSAGQGPGDDLDIGSKPSAEWLDKTKPVGERLKGLNGERIEKFQAGAKAYRVAKDDGARRASERLAPHHQAYSQAFMTIEQEIPNTREGFQALFYALLAVDQYIMREGYEIALSDEESANRQRNYVAAAEVIRRMRPYALDPKIAIYFNVITITKSLECELFLREILLKNTDKTARGKACFELGRDLCRSSDIVYSIVSGKVPIENYERRWSKDFVKSLVDRGSDGLEKEGLKLLDRVITEFPDVDLNSGQPQPASPLAGHAMRYIEAHKRIAQLQNR